MNSSFDCLTPVISGVGHEVDFTIADFAADLRAATPTAAAEAAVFPASDYLEGLAALSDHMERIVRNRLEALKLKLERDTSRLHASHPRVRLERSALKLYDLRRRSTVSMERILQDRKNRLTILNAKLTGLSPLARLTGGFGYIEQNGKPVPKLSEVKPGETVTIRMRDTRADARILQVETEE